MVSTYSHTPHHTTSHPPHLMNNDDPSFKKTAIGPVFYAVQVRDEDMSLLMKDHPHLLDAEWRGTGFSWSMTGRVAPVIATVGVVLDLVFTGSSIALILMATFFTYFVRRHELNYYAYYFGVCACDGCARVCVGWLCGCAAVWLYGCVALGPWCGSTTVWHCVAV